MPESSRSRMRLGLKVLAWALSVGAAVVTFGFTLGWRPVLMTLGVSSILALVFFSAYLHRRAWVVIREELSRSEELLEFAKMTKGYADKFSAQGDALLEEVRKRDELIHALKRNGASD